MTGMIDQPSLFDVELDVAHTIPARSSDPETSHAATAAITVRANTQRAYLLAAFVHYDHDLGLTDEEACHRAPDVSLGSEYAKRCSELREAGLIAPTGAVRRGASGMARIVSRVTPAGRRVLAAL